MFQKEFHGLKINDKFLCQDCLQSNTSGNLLYRWCKATITSIDSYRIGIHFDGRDNRYDIYLDLENEWTRIAPYDLISEEQIMGGYPLDDNQKKIVIDYVRTGKIDITDFRNHSKYSIGQKVRSIITSINILSIISINCYF